MKGRLGITLASPLLTILAIDGVWLGLPFAPCRVRRLSVWS